jgi:phage gpG-like protein
MASVFKWNGPQFLKLLVAELRRRLSACAVVTTNHARKLISVEGTGKSTTKVRNAKGKLVKRTKLIYGAHPSKPGEPPRKQTGRLAASVAWEIQGLSARVGTNVKYGRWLELATTHMAARPWLRRALKEMQGFIRAVMCRPWWP